MGLGKTLTMLALIAGSRDYLDHMHTLSRDSLDSSSAVHASNTTLIVTPLSSMYKLQINGFQATHAYSALPGWEDQIKKLVPYSNCRHIPMLIKIDTCNLGPLNSYSTTARKENKMP